MTKHICKSCSAWFLSDIETENELVMCPSCKSSFKSVLNRQGILTIEPFKCVDLIVELRQDIKGF